MGKIKAFFRNKWVGFALASLLYTLWFVVWTGNLWMLLGLAVIFDLYITKFFYRYVWCHNARMCQQSKVYKTVYEWVNAIIFATVVASLVHIFVFQMYVIPTSSMEKSLLIGDYLYVSKVTYGPQMPNTPLSFPFVHHTMPFSQTKKSFSEAVKWPYHRLKGLRKIKRNDVVVFNFPAGDTVLLENQNATYYDVLRSYEDSFGKEEGRKRLAEKYTIISRPVDKRENYIKRCVAVPGDSLEIRNGQVWVNGAPQEGIPGIQYQYAVQVSSPLSQYAIENLGITEYRGNGSVYDMFLTEEAAGKIEALNNVISVRRYIFSPNTEVFPQWKEPHWSQDNYGPIWVPKKGATVELTAENLTALEKKSGCGRVIIEYNGMWLIQELYDALPDNWLVYQSLATADGTTIKTYAGDSAMRSLLLDKLRGSELLVVNRAEAVNDDESHQLIHKLVRQASRRCDIAYEFKDGSVAYDDIPDPLPFDINADPIDIPADDFGIWYMDCQDEPQKYTGKTVRFLAQVCQTNRAGKDSFVPGRFAMTCCVQDIQFVGFPCSYDGYKALEQRAWVRVTARVGYKFHLSLIHI